MTGDQQFIIALLTLIFTVIPSIIAAVKGIQNGQKADAHTAELATVHQLVNSQSVALNVATGLAQHAAGKLEGIAEQQAKETPPS